MLEVYALLADNKLEEGYSHAISILGTDKIVKNLQKSLKKVKLSKDKNKDKKDKDKDKGKDKNDRTLSSVYTLMMRVAEKRLTPTQLKLFRQAF